MSNAIPIRNIYYLFLYSWDKFEEGKSLELSSEQIKDLPNLLSNILVNATKRIVKKGLYRVYNQKTEKLSFVKGKTDIPLSLKKNAFINGKLFCINDEISSNAIPNKILKKTLANLLINNNLNKEIKNDIKPLMRYFDGVESHETISKYFSTLRLNNNNYFYKFAMNLCHLLDQATTPTRERGSNIFKDISEDEVVMSSVFELFLRNFYKIEQNNYRVSSERFSWDLESEGGDLSLIQDNITDITLRSPSHTLVIDAKFYKDPLTYNFGNPRIRQDHFRQITSYLMNMEGREGPDSKADGMLIYPQVSHQEKLNEDYKYRGHNIKIRSINLDDDWKNIHEELMNFIN